MKLSQQTYRFIKTYSTFSHWSFYDKELNSLGQLEHAKSSALNASDYEMVQRCLYPAKYYANAVTLGGAPLLRRSARSFIGHRTWAGVAYAVPGVALALAASGVAPAIVFAAIPFCFIPHRRPAPSAWEWRLCAAIDRRIVDNAWGRTKDSVKREQGLISSFKALVSNNKTKRLRESETIFFHILRWESEIDLRLQSID